jgi:hypothetical protein
MAECSYEVHLIDGRRLIATMPADAEGPAPSYCVRGETWNVVSHSELRDEGRGRFSWVVSVERHRR